MNTKHKGIATEIEVMLAFVRLGYPVLLPYGDNERYDFAVDVGGKFVRIQCKTAHATNNGETFTFDTRTVNRKKGENIHHKYTPDEVEFLATAYNGQCYLVPVGRYQSTAVLRLTGQDHGGAWAKNYELEKIVKTW